VELEQHGQGAEMPSFELKIWKERRTTKRRGKTSEQVFPLGIHTMDTSPWEERIWEQNSVRL